MAKMAGMSEDYVRAARHATVCSVSKKSEKSVMAEMFNMTTRHIMHSLGKPAV
jgi:hypothetical protein